MRVSSYSDEPFAMKCLVEDLIVAIFFATSGVVPLVVSSQHIRKEKLDGKAGISQQKTKETEKQGSVRGLRAEGQGVYI